MKQILIYITNQYFQILVLQRRGLLIVDYKKESEYVNMAYTSFN
jgi:hypothetical protein